MTASDYDRPTSSPGGRSAAVDVSFTPLADHSQYGESSSQAESRSSGKRSGETKRESKESGGGGSQSTPSSRASTEGGSRGRGQWHRNRKSGDFLLGSVFTNGHAHDKDDDREGDGEREREADGRRAQRYGKRQAHDGHLHVGKQRHAYRLSMESSHGSSPLSREVSMGDGADERPRSGPQHSRTSSMDPAQLVQMALELSESRRRHASGSMHLSLPSPRDNRRASGFSSHHGAEQRRASARASTSHTKQQLLHSNQPPRQPPQAEPEAIRSDSPLVDSIPDHFSSATLARAEKARKYFELASEHRRLLQCLPPLKPDADVPGNNTFVSTSSPHTTYPQIERFPSHQGYKYDLGRQYNPLQALRNRRLRTRERRPLPAPTDLWVDTERTRLWIDNVEGMKSDPEYRKEPDRVLLPTFDEQTEAEGPLQLPIKSQGRTDTPSPIFTRAENGWSIEPPELLADTYWTEKADNKALIENRHGNLIFQSRVRDSLAARRSAEMGSKTQIQEEKGHAADHVPFNKRAHRRTLLLPKRHRHLAINRSPSVTSVSSDEGRLAYGSEGGDENVGPLARHMQQMIAKDEEGELSSPDMMSPDRPDSEHTQFPVLRGHIERTRRDTNSHGERQTPQVKGRLSVDAPRPRRARSAEGRLVNTDDPEMSAEDLLSNNDPTSPQIPDIESSSWKETKPYDSRASPTERQKNRRRRLPLFRSRSKDRDNIGRTDFALGTEMKAAPGDANDPRTSQESSRPFLMRHRTTDNSSSSLRRQGTHSTIDSTKEQGSAVGRFLKGSRIGDLVRNDRSRFGDRFRSRERLDEVNHGSGIDASDRSERGDDGRDVTEDDGRPSLERRGSRPKYNIPNLPSFTSSAGRSKETPGSKETDPIAQQQFQRAAARSPRFDRLAPPHIELPVDSDVSTQGAETAVPSEQKRKSYDSLEADSKAASQTSLAFGNWQAEGRAHDKRFNQIKHGHRHWSISDRLQSERTPSGVTARDVARVRALLLSSGVKAREIQRRGDSPPDDRLPVIQNVLQFVGKELGQVPRKEEHIEACRMLSDDLSSTLETFGKTIEGFEKGPAQSLGSQLDDLLHKASEQLAKKVQETSDEADAFIVELTTRQPQDIKRVDDAIDEMLRQRRRQFRLLRRAGFKLLEWTVLSVMWWVWFVVVMFNTLTSIVGFVLGLVRWLFWF